MASSGREAETVEARIHCPDCGWVKTIEFARDAAFDDLYGDRSKAAYFAENDAAWHAAEKETFRGEVHRPFVYSESGVRRYEPSVGEFVE